MPLARIQALIERYRTLLHAHASAPDERGLLEAASLGRALVQSEVPPEEVVECHEQELARLAAAPGGIPPGGLARLSQPLMEVFVAYGLAFRERLDALREGQAFLSTIIDTAAALIMVLDAAGRVVRFNPACEKLSGHTAAEMEGREPWSLLPQAEERETMRAALMDVGAPRADGGIECPWPARDGTRHLVSWSSSALRDAGGGIGYIVAVGIDVTQQRLVEEQANHRERLAATGRLAAGVAHEIGNPLAGIQGVAEVLLAGARDAKTKERLESVIRQVERITTIVRQMMDLSRPPRQDRRLCRIETTLAIAINLLRYDKRASGIAIDVAVAPELPRVLAIEDQMQQVFVNVGLNALDALRDAPTGRAPRLVVRALCPRPDGVVITFEDNGPGISPSVKERLFEPFVTSKEGGRGTGLGLAVCRRIVRDHGGEIHAEAVDAGGARFVIELPAMASDLPRGPDTP